MVGWILTFILRKLFLPPIMPPIPLPLPVRWVPGVRAMISETYKAVYYIGVLDGFVVGFCLATGLILFTALKQPILKGLSDVSIGRFLA